MMTTKGLSGSRSHHHAMTCDPSYDPMSLEGASAHRPYFLGGERDSHPADHPYYAQRGAAPDLASCTFPRRYASHQQLVPYTGPPAAPAQGGGAKSGGMSKSWGNNNNHSLMLEEQFDGQAATLRRHEGYHTLQYRRCAAGGGGAGGEHPRSDSPGRIRHLVHSVQKLFAKSHSLEGPAARAARTTPASSRRPPPPPPSPAP